MDKRMSAFVALCGLVLLVGCSPGSASGPPAPTPKRALAAFDAMYPGFTGTSAESSAASWMVTGTYAMPEYETTIPVRVPVRPGGSGLASATVDGVRWSGTADLLALTEVRRSGEDTAFPVIGDLGQFANEPGFLVTDARRETTDSISVTVETTDVVRPPIVFKWDGFDWWTDSGTGGTNKWLHTVGGVKVGYDGDVTKVLGPGLFTSEEGHGGGRYYTNPGHTVTLHVEIGTDDVIDTVELTDGVALPNGLRASDDPAFVSRALVERPALDGRTRLGATVAAVIDQFGQPDQDLTTGVQRILTYDLLTGGDAWSQSQAFSKFTFVDGKLRSVSYFEWE